MTYTELPFGRYAMYLIAGLGVCLFAYDLMTTLLGDSPVRLALPAGEQTNLKIFVLGDQGSHQLPQWRVARAMENVAEEIGGASLVMLAGDNFYSRGVDSVDDPAWRYNFENVYRGEHLDGLPFYAVLGNHDVKGNAEAQIEYGNHQLGSNRWHMKGRHYFEDFGRVAECDPTPLLRVVFIDTTDTANSWADEAEYVTRVLADSQAAWRFVIGHHPVRNYGGHGENSEMNKVFLPVLTQASVDLYIAGHDHNQQIIQTEKPPTYLVSGAGGKGRYPVNKKGKDLVAFSEDFGFTVVDMTKEELTLSIRNISNIPVAPVILTNKRPVKPIIACAP